MERNGRPSGPYGTAREETTLKIAIALIAALLIACSPLAAQADPFSLTHNFDAVSGTPDYSLIEELNVDGDNFLWDFDIQSALGPCTINSGTLTIGHRWNAASENPNAVPPTGERWLAYTAEGNHIGTLAKSSGTVGWVYESFTLSPAIIAEINEWDWFMTYLREITPYPTLLGDPKNVWVDYITLSGDYTPAPLPGALVFLGSGLVGLGILKRRG